MRRAHLSPAVGAVVAALVLSIGATHTPAAAAPVGSGSSGVVTWAASADQVGDAAHDPTYRLVVHTSVGGSGLRIRLSNALGDQPVTFGRAYAGVRRVGAAVNPGSNRRLSFGGSPSVTVRPGGVVYSDPLPGNVAAQSDLAVSVYVSVAGGRATGHGMAMQTSYLATGDHAADEAASAFSRQTGSWFYLDALVVDAQAGTGAVVVFGDSITDGWQSSSDRNNRWPDYLARRLAADSGSDLKGIANEGISGNKVLSDGAGQSALNRLYRDVLSQEGVRTVILLEGINDLKAGNVPTANMISGYRQIIATAHAEGKCVVGATILPYQGWGEWNAAGEAIRQETNTFIRTSREFDALIDLDQSLRSPYDHTRMFPPFDGGDHLHPNDKGMQAMADSVDLASLRCNRRK
jgi:lysophospholipase L1-like esterase